MSTSTPPPFPDGAMGTEGPADHDPLEISHTFRLRRIKQFLYAILTAIAGASLQSAIMDNWPTLYMLLVLAALMVYALWQAFRGQLVFATNVMLISVTVLVTGMAWISEGVHDETMLAYPTILIYASMLGKRPLFLAILATMILAIGAMVLVNTQGWYVNKVPVVGIDSFVNLSIVLALTAFSVWVMASDLRRALSRLKAENARVRQSQEHVAFLANHDALTTLPNRNLTLQRFNLRQVQARQERTHIALLYMDLDNFKNVNDSMGHLAGDELLCEFAARLQRTTQSTDSVCRLGGDEFLIMLGNIQNADDAATAALTVLEALATPMRLNGHDIAMSCSIGIAIYPEDAQDFDTLLKNAHIAMSRAKDAGRDVFRFYDAQMNDAVIEHLHLVTGMRTAIARNEFTLHYQPKIDLRTQQVVGAEALIRWKHPELGLIPPARFIPVAESSGLIIEIGAWAMREACRQAAEWRQHGLVDLVVSVNLSSVQFRRDDIERLVLNALDQSGLPARNLELELTESLLIADSTALTALLHRLRTMGVTFSIDDFGTGYSNLSYLKRFEVERLKIDQSFVRRLTEDQQDEAIVRAIIQMAHSLNLDTVAEGVECEATLARLIELGCDHGQGFYWAPGLSADAFVQYVDEQHAKRADSDAPNA